MGVFSSPELIFPSIDLSYIFSRTTVFPEPLDQYSQTRYKAQFNFVQILFRWRTMLFSKWNVINYFTPHWYRILIFFMRIIPLIRLICLNPSTRRNNNKKYDVNLFVAITKTTLDISIIFIQKPNLRGRFYGTHYIMIDLLKACLYMC